MCHLAHEQNGTVIRKNFLDAGLFGGEEEELSLWHLCKLLLKLMMHQPLVIAVCGIWNAHGIPSTPASCSVTHGRRDQDWRAIQTTWESQTSHLLMVDRSPVHCVLGSATEPTRTRIGVSGWHRAWLSELGSSWTVRKYSTAQDDGIKGAAESKIHRCRHTSILVKVLCRLRSFFSLATCYIVAIFYLETF